MDIAGGEGGGVNVAELGYRMAAVADERMKTMKLLLLLRRVKHSQISNSHFFVLFKMRNFSGHRTNEELIELVAHQDFCRNQFWLPLPIIISAAGTPPPQFPPPFPPKSPNRPMLPSLNLFLFVLTVICIPLQLFIEAKLGHKQQRRPSYYWSNRQLECANHGLNISRCSLREEGRVSELNPGCFDEIDTTNQTRVYCRLNCEEADETTVLRKEPSNNHICSAYHTYNLERRRRDWYIWRVGACISTTITFALRCGFPSDPRVFYAKHKHLFEHEDFNGTAAGKRDG